MKEEIPHNSVKTLSWQS